MGSNQGSGKALMKTKLKQIQYMREMEEAKYSFDQKKRKGRKKERKRKANTKEKELESLLIKSQN